MAGLLTAPGRELRQDPCRAQRALRVRHPGRTPGRRPEPARGRGHRGLRSGPHPRGGGLAMAGTTDPPPQGRLPGPPGLTPEAEEAGYYHEAGLNASWTGVRLALGALSFGF